MRLTRIFYPYKIDINTDIVLDTKASNHLLRVLRLEIDASLTLFNGDGGEFFAKISAIKNHCAVVKIIEFISKTVESPLKIHLAQGIGRGEKMDYVIQKAVELGVYQITPLFTEYCNVKLNEERAEKKISHWQPIIISACEQSGRNYLPKIAAPQNLINWLEHDVISENKNPLKIILDPSASSSLTDIYNNHSEVTILVGPEGGLSANEIELAKKHNFIGIKLGPRILRTETAALAAISALQTKFGDFRGTM